MRRGQCIFNNLREGPCDPAEALGPLTLLIIYFVGYVVDRETNKHVHNNKNSLKVAIRDVTPLRKKKTQNHLIKVVINADANDIK